MKIWSWFILVGLIMLSACGSLPDAAIQGTMPLPGAELSRVAPGGPGAEAELTASPTASPTGTVTATPPPTGTATLLPTLTSPPTDLPTATPTDTAPPTAPPTALPTETTTPPPPEPEIKVDRDLKFKTEDGLEIVGTMYSLQEAQGPLPGVIILPMHIEDQTAWKPFARQLAKAGYAALTVDLRGQGATAGSPDWQKAISDVRLVWREFGQLDRVDETRTALIGASLGANLALVAASAEPAIQTVVLISPGLNYNGIITVQAMGAYGRRPIMLIGSKADPFAQNGAVELAKLAQGEAELKDLEGAQHGTALFTSDPSIADSITRFLDQVVKEGAGAPPPQAAPEYGLGSLLLGLLASLAGTALLIAGAYLAYNRLSKPAQVSELLSIHDLTPQRGLVLIKGRIDELPKPLEKDETKTLVAIRLLIEEHDPEEGWKTRYDQMKSTHFWLREEHGLVWVAADQLDETQLGEGHYASTKQAEEALKILGHEKSAAWGKGLRHRIWELRVGQAVSVIGQVRQRLSLISTPEQPLVISPLAGGAPVRARPPVSARTRIGTILVMLVVGASMLCMGSLGVVNTLRYWLR
ncbi:MAG TPA: alpha/beta fold hydrolase [Anaerolineales bacterium]|nr:alpha/beta fold hydrolase [Anaerolineales bacterium]